MNNIYNYSKEDFENYFLENNDKKFRGTQLFEAIYRHRYNDFSEISNINKVSREALKDNFEFTSLEVVTVQEDKSAVKFLFKLQDELTIEAVLMRQDYGNSLCVSSQVGCNIGCTFCESGRMKKKRDLIAAEMVLQVLLAEKHIGERISHIVVMGIGEPFDNYDNVLKFIRIVNDAHGLAIGARHITVSTAGLIKGIDKFAEEELQVNLAVSLHSGNAIKRVKLMPIAKANPLDELMHSVKNYIKKTNRRVTFEYVLISGVNDATEDAKELARLIKGINCYVNLIPYNETAAIDYKRSSGYSINSFYKILHDAKINVTVRREFGNNIDAACGQLSAKHNEEN